jgi:hypothetical protein
LAAADLSLIAAEKLTDGVRAPSGIDLGAIKFVSKTVTDGGALMSGYQAIRGDTAAARALGRQDLAFTAFGEMFPVAAPFVSVPYAAGRFARGVYDAATTPTSVLDKLASSPPTKCP